MESCVRCEEEFDQNELNEDGACEYCAPEVTRRNKFAAFAGTLGLSGFPDPTGERYVYELDGTIAGKKGECLYFMDELWNALVKSQGRTDLQI